MTCEIGYMTSAEDIYPAMELESQVSFFESLDAKLINAFIDDRVLSTIPHEVRARFGV